MSADHLHHHDHDSTEEMSFDDKLAKLLSHWIKHNENHAINYRNWSEKAKRNGKDEAAALLEAAADMSLAVNEKFEAALAGLDIA
ncbi:hypothetical protein D1AOALGA4SA_282 [Olavius algarvensis Delta 1 endosymbiont]|nr:hypothetical protein D1AOALGA4SA_282 [Olavius algarvensis Delta 1 endosymbiont]